MSLLDTPRESLNPAIWDPDDLLLPEVKEEIMDKLFLMIPKSEVRALIFIGSAAGLQYNEYSDIDIQVITRIPPGREGQSELAEYHQLFKYHNNTFDFLTGTKHPINYFALVEYIPDYHDEANSIYLIEDFDTGEKDVWLRPYLGRDEIRSVENIVGNEMQFAAMYARMIRNRIGELAKDVGDLPEYAGEGLRGKLEEIENDIADLIFEYKRVDWKRKLQYDYGWGIPKLSPSNLLYKFLERENLLYFLERLKDRMKEKKA
jgi:hypothetical protein